MMKIFNFQLKKKMEETAQTVSAVAARYLHNSQWEVEEEEEIASRCKIV